MRIGICGFYGFGNVGDEAVLQSIMEQLGHNEYIINTSLPPNRWNDYRNNIKLEVRSHEDSRTDVDAYILGGGDLNWGYGWRQCLSMFSSDICCMNYSVGYNKKWYYSEKLHGLYREFLKNFNIITVRDECSLSFLREIDDGLNILSPVCTFDPAINLKEEQFDCPKGKIVVFPRYEDVVSNIPQLEWFLQELKDVSHDVILVPCAPVNNEGVNVDLELCFHLNKKLEGSKILYISPFEPRKLKYLVSQSKLVYSGGRYHPIVFAIAHDISFRISPTADLYTKIPSLVNMYNKFGRDGLVELANRNKDLFNKEMS